MKKHEFKIEITADISKVSEVYEAVSLVEGVEIKVLDCIEVNEAVRPKVTGAKRGRKKQKYKVEEDPNAVTIYKNGKHVLDVDATIKKLGITKDYLKKNSFKRDALECRLKYAMAIKASRWSKH